MAQLNRFGFSVLFERGSIERGHGGALFTEGGLELHLPKIMLQGTVNGSCRRGRPRLLRKDNVKKWTGQSVSSLLHIADDIQVSRY